MKKIILCAVLTTTVVFGCNNEQDLGPENEEFVGTYLVRDLTIADSELKDSIIFNVKRNTTYSMFIYHHISGTREMCSNSGTILDFGTGKASFDPTSVDTNGTCQNRAPFGTFQADFINHPGEIHITKSVKGVNSQNEIYDSLYQIILRK